MLKARAVVKLNRVVRWPMTEALERAPNSWAARLEAIGVGDVYVRTTEDVVRVMTSNVQVASGIIADVTLRER